MSGNVVRTWDDVQARVKEAQARTLTATVAGANIDADAEYVVITSSVATKICNLPSAVTGKVLRLYVTANGCELRSVVATDDLNGVLIGATNEAALLASVEYELRYNNGNWVMTGVDSAGAVSALVVPDVV